MAEFSNAQKLSAVVAEWLRPAVAQIASSKLGAMSWMQQLQTGIMGLGIVGSGYNISDDLLPILSPAVESLIEPMLYEQFRKLPDAAIPKMARDIADNLEKSGKMSLLDGLVDIDANDIKLLKRMIEKNLPLSESKTYKVIDPT